MFRVIQIHMEFIHTTQLWKMMGMLTLLLSLIVTLKVMKLQSNPLFGSLKVLKIYWFVPEFVISPAPGYTYRTIGGLLDIYIFLGPTPEDTVRQFTEAIGRQPIPPYWGLGFQLSRWGYNTIDKMKAAVNRTKAANIPQVCAIIH